MQGDYDSGRHRTFRPFGYCRPADESCGYGGGIPGDIIPVELTAHDLDGAEGLYVPDSQERTAAKEAAASIGSGSAPVLVLRSAGQQVAMDLVRGA